MSRKLQDFLKMMAREKGQRSETEMGSFVTWLRRRSALLKNLDISKSFVLLFEIIFV